MTWRTVQVGRPPVAITSAPPRSTAQEIAPLRFPDNQCETNERNTDAREKENVRMAGSRWEMNVPQGDRAGT